MPRLLKKKYYDLTKPFEDDLGNRYGRRAADHLCLWIEMTATTPTSKGPIEFDSVVYNNSPVAGVLTSLANGATLRNAVTFNDAAHKDITVTPKSTGGLDFTKAEDGATAAATDDKAFSISFWANMDDVSAGASHGFFGKEANSSHRPATFALINGSGIIKWYLHNNSSNTVREGVITTDDFTSLIEGKWAHLVFTYDGRGGTTASAGMKIYVNGVSQSVTSDDLGTYAGMQADFNGPFHIGANYTGTQEMDGQMAEFAAWNGYALTADEVEAIYHRTRFDARVSGILNNPPRTLLVDADNKEGAYPPVLRTGDKDFRGKSLHPFDDRNTVSFVSNYSEAEIEFTSRDLDTGTFVGLTGSLGERNFVFFNHPPSLLPFVNDVGTAAKRIAVDLSGSAAPTIIATDGSATSLDAIDDKELEKYAVQLARAINNASIGIKAITSRGRVKLKHQTPQQGSYPTNKILSGNLPHSFAMTTTDPFKITQFSSTSRVKTTYPQNLPNSHKLMSTAIATPNAHGGISAQGSTEHGIGDSLSNPSVYSKESLTAFDDSEIHIGDSKFFRIGTPKTIFPGFTAPLKSKTSFSFVMNSSNGRGTHIFFATASQSSSFSIGGPPSRTGLYHQEIFEKIGSGMAYWNKDQSRWEMLAGDGSVDVHHHSGSERIKGCLGFSPSAGEISFNLSGSASPHSNTPPTRRIRDYWKRTAGAVGHPIKEFGFPVAKQYNATSSHCINMSDYISSPFLLEKMTLEIEGDFGLTSFNVGHNIQPIQKQFFVLNQMTDGDNPHYENTYTINHVTASGGAKKSESLTLTQRGLRELIGYAKISFVPEKHPMIPHLTRRKNAVRVDDLYDHLVIAPSTDFNTGFGTSGSMFVEFEPTISSDSDGVTVHHLRKADRDIGVNHDLLLTNDGGADLLGNASGRQIGSSYMTGPVIGTSGSDELTREYRDTTRQHSPYLLLPEDRIVFGWQNRPGTIDADVFFSDSPDETEIAKKLVDRLSKTKVTFFGSLISNEVETHENLNQPLVSNAIHEVIGAEKVLDQFEVSSLKMLSGSYGDAVMTGKMFTGTRRRRASIARGTGGATGSMAQRNSTFIDDAFIYKDSAPISIKDIVDEAGVSEVTIGGVVHNAVVIADQHVINAFDIAGVTTVGVGSTTLQLSNIRQNSALNSIEPFAPMIELNAKNLPGGSAGTAGPTTPSQHVTFPPGPPGTPGGFLDGLNEPSVGGTALNSGVDFLLPHNIQNGIGFSNLAQDIGAGMGMNIPGMAFSDPSYLDGGGSVLGEAAIDGTHLVQIGFNPLTNAGTYSIISGSHLDRIKTPHDDFLNIDSVKQTVALSLGQSQMLMQMMVCGYQAGPQPATPSAFYQASGFKYGYGFMGAAMPRVFFRRGKFGQFRDMMETYPEAVFRHDKSKIDVSPNAPGASAVFEGYAVAADTPPVEIEFVSRGGIKGVAPETTNSQNLSYFHTSSKPYYDGLTVDRTDRTPDLEDVITIASDVTSIIDE